MAEATKVASAAEIWPLIREQRNKLGDLLETLSAAEWETTSLCQGWRVRDVVAHCIQTHLVTPWSLIGQWIVSGFSRDQDKSGATTVDVKLTKGGIATRTMERDGFRMPMSSIGLSNSGGRYAAGGTPAPVLFWSPA